MGDNNPPEVPPSHQMQSDNRDLNLRSKVIIICGFALIVLEIAFHNSDYYKPSIWLRLLAAVLKDAFVTLGSTIVWVAIQVYAFINIKILAVALYDLITPLAIVIFSPYYTLEGLFLRDIRGEMSFLFFMREHVFAVLSFFALCLFLLVVTENQCPDKYKPTKALELAQKGISKVYKWIAMITMDFLQFYKFMGLDKFVETTAAICQELCNIAISPVVSYTKEFSTINITTAAAFATILFLYLYGYGYIYNMILGENSL